MQKIISLLLIFLLSNIGIAQDFCFTTSQIFNNDVSNYSTKSLIFIDTNKFILEYLERGNIPPIPEQSFNNYLIIGEIDVNGVIDYGEPLLWYTGEECGDDVCFAKDVKIIKLDTNKFVIASEIGGYYHGAAIVGEIDPITNDIILGNLTFFNGQWCSLSDLLCQTNNDCPITGEICIQGEYSSGCGSIDLVSLSNNKFVVVYRDFRNAEWGTGYVGSVNGLNIDFGNKFILGEDNQHSCCEGRGAEWNELVQIDSAYFIWLWSRGPSCFTGYARICNISGNNIVCGNVHEWFSHSIGHKDTKQIDSNKFVLIFYNRDYTECGGYGYPYGSSIVVEVDIVNDNLIFNSENIFYDQNFIVRPQIVLFPDQSIIIMFTDSILHTSYMIKGYIESNTIVFDIPQSVDFLSCNIESSNDDLIFSLLIDNIDGGDGAVQVMKRCAPYDPIASNDLNMACLTDDECPKYWTGTICSNNRCYVLKNRYISIENNSNNTGYLIAMRIQYSNDGYNFFDIGWIGPPSNGYASIVSNPYYTDWSVYDNIYIKGCGISPEHTYKIQTIYYGDDINNEMFYSDGLYLPTVNKWCDVVGPTIVGGYLPPDGVVALNDVTAAINKFTGNPNSPPLQWVDVSPENVDQVVNLTDIMSIMQAFQGSLYPYKLPGQCQ